MSHIPGDGEMVALGQERQSKVFYDESAAQFTVELPAASDGVALPVGSLHVQDGGAVTQGSDLRTTGVTLSKFSGQVLGDNESLAAMTIVTHTVTNTLVDPEDHIILTKVSGDADTMAFVGSVGSGSFTVTLMNFHVSGADTTNFVYNVLVIKGSKT